MVLIMKHIFRLSFLLIIVLLFSCDKLFYVNCDECYTTEPVRIDVEILIGSGDGLSQQYDIVIYLGKVEDGVIVDSFTTGYNAYFEALLNNEYSVTATTVIGNREYRAVNSVTPTTELVQDMCTEDCFVVKNNRVDMRVKYY